MSYLAVSDIHGCLGQVRTLLSHTDAISRRVVFLGDYVNRGPDTKGVLDFLISFQNTKPDSVFLSGNHDWALRRFLKAGKFYEMEELGGNATTSSYVGSSHGEARNLFRNSFPPGHLAFLESLKPYFETSDYLFTHAGLNPASPQNRDFITVALNSHPDLFATPPTWDKTLVCGHYVQQNHQPFISRKFACIDTGCGCGGPLTGLLLPEFKYVQVSPDLSVSGHQADKLILIENGRGLIVLC